jgi:hypothetical protein
MMGTRSLIGIENTDGTVNYVYCHWDGYPSHNGRILLEHYRSSALVRSLLALGDISSLGPSIGDKHDFDSRDYEVTTFYGRDRGEDGVEMKTVADRQKFLTEPDMGQEWYYLWTDEGWLVSEGGVGFFGVTNPAPRTPYQPLTKELIEAE